MTEESNDLVDALELNKFPAWALIELVISGNLLKTRRKIGGSKNDQLMARYS